jgi:uncharacterized protein (TIGR03066 family)
MRAAFGFLALVGMASLTIAADETVDWSKLTGKWELVDGTPPQVLTVEFTAAKDVIVTVAESGKELKIEGKYKQIEMSNKILVTLKLANEEKQDTLTIKKLTADELETEDSKAKLEKFKRKK